MYRHRIILLSCLVFFLPLTSLAQADKDTLSFRVMSYNVENLFDTTDNPLTNDQDYLPTAIRRWNHYKYREKLDNIARTIIAVGEGEAPALVGLCEVEGDSVLHALTRYSALREAGYRYLMTHSQDERGINVALLYQRHLFKPVHQQSIVIKKPGKQSRPTRDILHVSGQLINGDTLDVFICHFPSRSSGMRETEPYRMQAATQLKQAADSLMRIRKHPQLLIMGDMNDQPNNRSIRQVLAAQHPTDEIHKQQLYHLLSSPDKKKRTFSYKYQGRWSLLDHILVSGTLLLRDATLHTSPRQAGVARLPFLLIEDNQYGGVKPFRSYHGMKYQGGYSDHLPVWAEFRLIY